MHAPLTEDHRLTPDNDPTPAPFGAFAPNAAQAGVMSDVDAGAKVLGSPAQPIRDFFRQIATLKKMAKGEG